jgi:mannose/cellobiose epimerase-like protein (N-acyl-D-glucosamine 2-epimerase family)
MKRRNFIISTGAFAAGFLNNNILFGRNLSGAIARNFEVSSDDTSAYRKDKLTHIWGKTLEELKNNYEQELFDIIIPMWYRKGIDNKYGGFLCEINYEDETFATTDKNVWYQSRGLYTFSHIYRLFERDERHLKVMEETKDFLLKHCVDENYNWYARVSRDGRNIIEPKHLTSDMHAVHGFGEYYLATGDEKALHVAVNTSINFIKKLMSPSVQYQSWMEPGVSTYGMWFHFLSALTPLIEDIDSKYNTLGTYKYSDCERLKGMAALCVKRMKAHADYDRRMIFEFVDQDLKPLKDEKYRFIPNGHAVGSGWTYLAEALRIGDRNLFRKGMDVLHWHFTKGWDFQYGGGIINQVSPEKPDQILGDGTKPSFATDDGLIGLMFAIEHTHDPWAIEWFDRVRTWAYKTYFDKKKKLWIHTADRKGNPIYSYARRGNFHHPRSVMLIIESLKRQIGRKGCVSDFFD